MFHLLIDNEQILKIIKKATKHLLEKQIYSKDIKEDQNNRKI